MIYFTADTHFGHSNIIEYCNRPYKTVKSMNEGMINNWNSVVSPNDTVYHLGDFGFDTKDNLQKIFNSLNGKKYLIKGNHDNKVLSFPWAGVYNYKKIKFNKKTFILFHYPMIDWEDKFKGSIHLYGHVHNSDIVKNYNFDSYSDHRINVGVDVFNFTPVSAEDILFNLNYVYYITLGFGHVHEFITDKGNLILTHGTTIRTTRDNMNEVFGTKWAFSYMTLSAISKYDKEQLYSLEGKKLVNLKTGEKYFIKGKSINVNDEV